METGHRLKICRVGATAGRKQQPQQGTYPPLGGGSFVDLPFGRNYLQINLLIGDNIVEAPDQIDNTNGGGTMGNFDTAQGAMRTFMVVEQGPLRQFFMGVIKEFQGLRIELEIKRLELLSFETETVFYIDSVHRISTDINFLWQD